MKKIIFLWLIIANAQWTVAQKRTVFSGTVDHAVTGKTVIVSLTDKYQSMPINHDVTLDKNNKFKITFYISEPTEATIRIGNSRQEYIFFPNDSIVISTRGVSPFKNAQFQGKGAGRFVFMQKFNNALSANQNLPTQSTPLFGDSILQNTDADYFMSYCDSAKRVIDSLAVAYQQGVEADFLTFFKARWAYYLADQKMIYPLYRAYYLKQKSKEKVDEKSNDLPKNYYDFLEEMAINRDSLAQIQSYLYFSMKYLRHQFVEMINKSNRQEYSLLEEYRLATIMFTGKVREYVITNRLIETMRYWKVEDFEKAYQDYLLWNKDEKWIKLLSESYAQYGGLMIDAPAPPFTLMDINGVVVSLSDFFGKVVFIQFWNNSCEDCKKDFPLLKSLKEKLKDEDIVFLHISTESDENEWKNEVAKHQLEGIQLRDKSTNSTVQVDYDVDWFPYYLLIDRNGLIHTNSLDSPEDPYIEKTIRQALEKK